MSRPAFSNAASTDGTRDGGPIVISAKDDFSRMRVQKFSTAGQQIAMTKTSISVTFDNLAKLVYSLTASYEIGADCLWVADETSVQRDTNQCKHRKVVVRNQIMVIMLQLGCHLKSPMTTSL